MEASFAEAVLYAAVPIIIATVPDPHLEFSKVAFKGKYLFFFDFFYSLHPTNFSQNVLYDLTFRVFYSQ